LAYIFLICGNVKVFKTVQEEAHPLGWCLSNCHFHLMLEVMCF